VDLKADVYQYYRFVVFRSLAAYVAAATLAVTVAAGTHPASFLGTPPETGRGVFATSEALDAVGPVWALEAP